MKQRTQWIAAIFMAASAGLALAGPGPSFFNSPCGCDSNVYTEKVRLEPVREMIVERPVCAVQRPLIVRESTCLMEPRSSWYDTQQTIGGIATAPFRLLGSAFTGTTNTLRGQTTLIESQPAYVGERVTTVTTHHKWIKKHHMLKKVSYRSELLMPVGERFTTVKIIRQKPLLMPVGERISTVKIIRSEPLLEPVGERFTTVKVIHQKPLLMPVGEQLTTVKVIHSQPLLEPVGEKIITFRSSNMCPSLEPVGERTIIRTTRVLVNPWNSCEY